MRSALLLFLLASILCQAQPAEVPSPALVYGTFLEVGGDQLPSIATDANGDIYAAVADPRLACEDTPSGDLFCQGRDEFVVTRVSPGTQEPIYTTSFGAGRPAIAAIAVRADGHAFVTGQLGVFESPVTPPGATTGFVARIGPDGTVLYTARFNADAAAIAIDADGNAYVTGTAWDAFETTPGAYKTSLGSSTCPTAEGSTEQRVCPDTFILKLDPEGNTLLATYLGGEMEDYGRSIALDAAGNVYVSGETRSEEFPRTIGAAQPDFGGRGGTVFPYAWGDGFAVKFEPTVRRLEYATYLGGTARDWISQMAVDRAGSAVIVGGTQSSDLPVTSGVIQPEYRGDPEARPFPDYDGFAVKLTPAGAFAYVTYFGDSEPDSLAGVTLDADGNAYIAGRGYVDQPGAREPTPCDSGSHLTKLNADGSSILGTRYVGSAFGGWSPRISGVDEQTVSVVFNGVFGKKYNDTFATTPDAISTRGRTYIARLDFAAAPSPALACVLNAASFRIGHRNNYNYVISPYEILTFFGNDLGGAELTIDGQPAPLLFTGDRQINAVAPGQLGSGPVPVELSRDGEPLASYEVKVVEAIPALFISGSAGEGPAAALNQDGSLNSPSAPAKRGSVVQLFATGFGKLTPMPPDGSIIPKNPPWPELTHKFDAWIQAPVESGAVGMEILYAGPAPGLIAGAIQINVRIPENAATGTVLIQLILDNGEWTQRNTTLFIAP